MTTPLAKATLTPMGAGTETPDTSRKITLDFNPSTLSIKIANRMETPGKESRQRRQFIGSTASTLSFDAVFDTTRPSTQASGQALDVRRRTQPIAEFLQGRDNGGERVPDRVQFAWGSILFKGILDSYSETLEYFSPEGVPLRSKLSITLTEQSYQYQIESSGRARRRGGAGRPGPGGPGPGAPDRTLAKLGATLADAQRVAAQNGLDSLLALAGATDLGFDPDLPASSPPPPGALDSLPELAAAAGAGLPLEPQSALEVFGRAALERVLGAAVDLGRTPTRSPGGAAPRPPWAPDGPVPGSRAAARAALVNAARTGAAGPGGPGALPIAGSPPMAPPARSPPAPAVFPAAVADAGRTGDRHGGQSAVTGESYPPDRTRPSKSSRSDPW